MKLKIFTLVVFHSLILVAQPTFISVKPNDAVYIITEKIIRLEEFLNSLHFGDLNVDLTPKKYTIS
jgi:hypothetical protein